MIFNSTIYGHVRLFRSALNSCSPQPTLGAWPVARYGIRRAGDAAGSSAGAGEGEEGGGEASEGAAVEGGVGVGVSTAPGTRMPTALGGALARGVGASMGESVGCDCGSGAAPTRTPDGLLRRKATHTHVAG